MSKIKLRGMTWNHARGYDPMVATSRTYSKTHPNVEILWDQRSLQSFADRPIDEMASEYDLMVIDHPHVGEVASSGELLALNGLWLDDELANIAKQTVGASHCSYEIDGHQWALAIDAATPVAAFRPDRLKEAPKNWSGVLELAKLGQVAFALIPINALMTFMGMAKNLNAELAQSRDVFIDKNTGQHVLELMLEISQLMDPICLKLDPIGVLDWMGNSIDGPVYSPFGYGYTNYSRDDYCPHPLIFADAPGINSNDPKGTVIGGTGIAVSASSKHKEIAVDYAFWIAGAKCQSGLFFDAGGQPANSVAWENARCNKASRDFFYNTRRTLESSWLRPRYDGYMGFQDKGGDIVHACLSGSISINTALIQLEKAYRESYK